MPCDGARIVCGFAEWFKYPGLLRNNRLRHCLACQCCYSNAVTSDRFIRVFRVRGRLNGCVICSDFLSRRYWTNSIGAVESVEFM